MTPPLDCGDLEDSTRPFAYPRASRFRLYGHHRGGPPCRATRADVNSDAVVIPTAMCIEQQT